MKILVFTAKWIGLNCVKHLINAFPEDEYEFVVCEPESESILLELASHNLKGNKISNEQIAKILDRPDDYYDWLLNVWGSHIFKNDLLRKAKNTLNIHPSYLPYCRGRDPVVWALKYKWPAGVTLHQITNGVDEGAIWYQEEVPYSFPCTGGEVYQMVAQRCWEVFSERWVEIRSLKYLPIAQKEIIGIRTFKRKELRLDQVINTDENETANEIIRKLMAHNFGSDYSAEVVIDSKRYRAYLKLDPIE